MSTENFYAIVGVNGGELVTSFFSTASGPSAVIDVWQQMSHFGAYRSTPDSFDLIDFTGTLTGDLFVEDPEGDDTLVVSSKDDYLRILVNDQWKASVNCDLHKVNVYELSLNSTEYAEMFGDDEPDGCMWDIMGLVATYTDKDPEWELVTNFDFDYMRTSSPHAQKFKNQLAAL